MRAADGAPKFIHNAAGRRFRLVMKDLMKRTRILNGNLTRPKND
jgi:hypothetical protein